MNDRPTLLQIADSVRTRRLAATDITQRCLREIEQRDAPLRAFRETCTEHAMAQAKRVDDQVRSGADAGLLAGVPIAVKDNIVTAFGTSSCGSRMLEGYRSPYSATAVQRLENAGAIIVGKTNCDEFAMGSSTENSAFGPTRNPWDVTRVPGGSSGGSAAAVAAGIVPASLGSDTGGSVRQPASFCGVVGVKPSYGRVSRYGLVAYGSSLDQIGPIARTVSDAAAILQVIAGPDPHDSTCSLRPVPNYLASIDQPVEGLRIGVPRQYLREQNHPAVNDVVERAIDMFRTAGATIVDVDLPLTEYGIATYYVIATAEASSNLARFDGIRFGRRATLEAGEELFDLYARSRAEGLGSEVQRRIMLGTYVLSAGYYDAYYKRALQVRRLITQEFDAAFSRCDALLGPTSPVPAFKFGEKSDPLTMYLCDAYTVNTNIAGICGISLNGGFAAVDGTVLPVGVQLQCLAFDEGRLFRIARQLERAQGEARRPPT